jgi:hypothetical protein
MSQRSRSTSRSASPGSLGAVKMAADFQSSMNTLQAVSHASAQQMNALRKEAIKLGADVKLPGDVRQGRG